MIACKNIDDQLLDLLYDEIPDGDRRAAEEHIEGCARCRGQLASFRRVRQAARTLPVAEPGGGLTAKLLEEAARHAAGRLPAPRPEAVGPAPTPITAARNHPNKGQAIPPRRRTRFFRVVRHPAFAVAATFVVVLGAARALLPLNESAAPSAAATAEGPASPMSAAPILPPSEAPLLVPAAPMPSPDVVLRQPARSASSTLGAADSPVPTLNGAGAAGGGAGLGTTAMARRSDEGSLPATAAPADVTLRDRALREAQGGDLQPFGGAPGGLVARAAPSLQGRAGPAEPPPPPPFEPRPAQGKGIWLGAEQNQVLDESIPKAPHPPSKALEREADALAIAPSKAEAPAGYAADNEKTNRQTNAMAKKRQVVDNLDDEGAAAAPTQNAEQEEARSQRYEKNDKNVAADNDVVAAAPPSAAPTVPAAAPPPPPAPMVQAAPSGATANNAGSRSESASVGDASRELADCRSRVSSYDRLQSQQPGRLAGSDERLAYARCLRTLGYTDKARNALVALGRDTNDSSVRSAVDRELGDLAAMEYVNTRHASRAKAAAPAAAPKKAKPAKPSSAVDF